MSDESKQLGHSIFWNLLRTWGGRLAGFVIYFQLARLLSPSDMGVFAACFAVIALLELLVDQGLVHAVVQRKELGAGLLNAVFLTNLGLAALMIAVSVLFAPRIESLMSTPGLGSVVMVSSIALIFSALGMCQEALARRAMDFKLLASRTLISTVDQRRIGAASAEGD